MSKRDTFLLRIEPAVLEDLKRWAESELRSTNAHIEYLLRKCLADAGQHSRLGSNQTCSNIEDPELKEDGL